MTFSSSLLDDSTTLVIDTSVIINLQASKIGEEILRVIDNPFVATMEVADEIKKNSKNLYQETVTFLDSIIGSKLLRIITLTLSEKDIFREVMNTNKQLDDGEAATITLAKNRDFTPIIDEKVGRYVALKELPKQTVGASLDLLFHSKVQSHFDKKTLKLAVHKALRDARMQIGRDQRDFVVKLIGKRRAKQCRCLPGYKSLMREWGETIE